MITPQLIQLQIPKPLLPLHEPHRYKVVSHGRGAAGSWTFARMLLIRGLNGHETILCCREIQRTIRDSVHFLLRRQIELLGLSEEYTVTDNEIRGPGYTRFIFRGLRSNPQEIKSTEGVTVAWVAEAQAVSQESWEVLIPTVRDPGSEIWIEFNPSSLDDATYRMFVATRQPGEWYTHITYRDNPWFPARLEADRQYMLATNRAKHDHIWLGQPLILTEYHVFEPTAENYYTDEEFTAWVHGQRHDPAYQPPAPSVWNPIAIPQARCDVRLSAGLDFGYEDADAFSIIAYSIAPGVPTKWLLYEHKERRESVTKLATAIKAGLAFVEEYTKQAGVIDRRVDISSDFGGGGKQISWELYQQHGIQCFEPAIKGGKDLAVDMLRDEVAERTFRFRKGGPTDDEMLYTVWQRDEQERLIRKIDDEVYHPDQLWANIYALRPVWGRKK